MSYKNFNLTDEIDSFIKDDDRDGILDTLISVCFRDSNFSTGEFDAGVEYTTQKASPAYPESKLYDSRCSSNFPLFGEKVDAGESFEEADFENALTSLRLNFCEQRIEDMKKLGRSIYPVNPTQGRNSMNPFKVIAGVIAAIVAVIAVILFLKNLL